jgi:putative Mg2+ transporter-C (MgtC) family protein
VVHAAVWVAVIFLRALFGALPFGRADTEIGATLYATAVEPAELDRVIEDLESLDGVQQAFWNAAAEE